MGSSLSYVTQSSIRSPLDSSIRDEAKFIETSILSNHVLLLQMPTDFPLEVLQLIFSELNHDSEFVVTDKNHPQWAITKVCRRWRAAALGCPLLWATFGIKMRGRSPQRNTVALLRVVLERARALPLRFFFWPGCTPANEVEEILRMLVEHSEHWSISDIGPMTQAMEEALVDIRGRLPRLTRLTVRGDYHESLWYSGFRALLVETPQLRFLDLQDMPLMCIHIPPATCATLCHLKIRHTFSQHQSGYARHHWTPPVADIIRLFPALETLVVNKWKHRRDRRGTTPISSLRVQCTSLKALSVADQADLLCLELPNLENLEVNLPNWEMSRSLPSIIGLLQNSPRLRELALINCRLGVQSLAVLLNLIPDVERLAVFYEGISRRIVTKMFSMLLRCLGRKKGSQEAYVPQLTQLMIHSRASAMREQPSLNYINSHFVDMLSLRYRGNLRVVSLPLWNNIQAPFKKATLLRKLKEAGLTVVGQRGIEATIKRL